MWGKNNEVAFAPTNKLPHIDSGYWEDRNVVFISIETEDLRYGWTNEVELVDGIDIRKQLLDAEINLWTALVRRLVQLSKLE